MKNLTLATILIGLSGTALSAAAEDTTGLPADIQAQLTSAENIDLTAIKNPVQGYLKDVETTVDRYQTSVQTLMTEDSYLKQVPLAKPLETTINNYSTKIKNNSISLESAAKSGALPIEQSLNGIKATYQILAEQTFPSVCKTYDADLKTGWVKYVSGSKTQLALYENDNNEVKPIAQFYPNVGQLQTGKEYVPSIAINSQVNVQFWNDNGTNYVVCMDLASSLKPSTPTTDTTKPTETKK